MDGRKRKFGGAIFNGQRNFNILDIILRKGKHACFRIFGFTRCMSLHIAGRSTTAPVGNLDAFIYCGTVLSRHAAGADNKSVSIKHCAGSHGNIAAAFHFQITAGAIGRTGIIVSAVGGEDGCRNTHFTANSKVCTVCHGQGTEWSWVGTVNCIIAKRIRTGLHRRRVFGHSTACIEGDHQSVPRRNCIIPGEQRAIRRKNDRRAGCSRIAQVIEQITVIDLEPRRCGCAGKSGPDGSIFGRLDRIFCRGAQDCALTIRPAKESSAAGSRL